MELDIRNFDWRKLEVDLLAYVAEIRANVNNVSDPAVANDLRFLADTIETNTPLAIAAAQEELRNADVLEAECAQMMAQFEAKRKQLEEMLSTPPAPSAPPAREAFDEPLWLATRERLLGWVRKSPTPTNMDSAHAFNDWAYSSVNVGAPATIADPSDPSPAIRPPADSADSAIGTRAATTAHAGWSSWLSSSDSQASASNAMASPEPTSNVDEAPNPWRKTFEKRGDG